MHVSVTTGILCIDLRQWWLPTDSETHQKGNQSPLGRVGKINKRHENDK